MGKNKIKISFVFPGIGSQWEKMGVGLLADDVFRAALQECDRHLSRYVDWHIEEEIRKPADMSRLEDISIGYPCILAVEIALMELLKSWGIEPDAVIGHSGGEKAAAYTAGILNLPDFIKLVWSASIVMKKASGKGEMAHIGLPGENVVEILKNPLNRRHRQSEVGHIKGENAGKRIFAAAFNSPRATIVSGERKAIEKFVESLTKEKVFCRVLKASIPFHTPGMELYKNEFYNGIKSIRAGKASIPIYSSFRGGLSKENDYGPSYWVQHMIKPVKFARGIRAMINDGYTVFLEISPHPILSQNIEETADDCGKENCSAIGTLKRDEDETQELFNCFARLSIAGLPISLEKLKGETRQRLKAAIASLTANARDSQDSRVLGLVKTLKTGTPAKREELISQLVKQSIREVLHQEVIPLDDPDLGFLEMGFNSQRTLQLKDSLSRQLGLPFSSTLIFDYPDIRSLTGYLMSLFSTAGLSGFDNQPAGVSKKHRVIGNDSDNDNAGDDNRSIAIIGMACRFPGGANNLESFWNLLKQGKNTVSEIPGERWNGDDYYSREVTPGKSITRRANFISGMDITTFDAGFFKISPKEAESLDPQQRLLLEVTVEALENAAISPLRIRDKEVGVFIGISMDDYKKVHLFSDDLKNMGPYSGSGSMLSPASGRISYFLGLRGPAVSVDTACSSSLAALHLAVQSLRNRECEMALAGGVNCLLSPNMFIYFTQLNVLSGDGICKTFDEKADGYGRGEGCGVFVLKRLSDAQKHHDNILAVIKGSALNQDGASTGFTAPNGIAQQQVLQKVLKDAGVSAGSIDYIEAHGSGTSLGDPIEINAIAQVYGKKHTMANPVLVGSVKTNIGHLEAAAGAAGVIKTVLALQHQAIPPHLHVSTPNPLIDWHHIPVKINTGLTPWKRNETPRRAGISSFGFSGSNAHIIIEEPPALESSVPEVTYPVHILNLSAQSQDALNELVESYRSYLSQHPLPDLSNTCYTASTGRSHFRYRFSAAGKNAAGINYKLGAYNGVNRQRGFQNKYKKEFNKKIVFLYTGQGSHYPGMGKELYRVHPVFKVQLDRCDKLFRPHIKTSLVDLLYSGKGNGRADILDQALYTQPAIFSLQYALSQLWESFGVKPSIVIGHSIGEYAAACTAGVFSLEEAVRLVAARAKMMQSVPVNGEMVGILAGEQQVKSLISKYDDVSIAAVNTAENVTISGARESVEKILEQVKKSNIFIERLNISHPFHSVLIEPYVEEFRKELAKTGIVFSEPVIPIIPVCGGSTPDITGPDYWVTQLCEPVRFYDRIKQVEKQGYQLFLEIGSTAVLSGLASQCISDENTVFLPSMRKGRNQWEQLLSSLAQLYIHGIDIDWDRFHGPGGKIETIDQNPSRCRTRKVLLPNYPFQRKRYWHKDLNTEALGDNPIVHPVEENENMDEILSELGTMVHTISGLNPDEVDDDTGLFSLGMDSLMLVELRRKINGKYGIDITLNEFFMELTTLNKIAGHIKRQSPRVREAQRIPVNPGVDKPAPLDRENGLADAGTVERIMARQWETMEEHSRKMADLAEKQLEILKNLPLNSGVSFSPDSRMSPALEKNEPVHPKPKPLSFSAKANIDKRGFTPAQQRHLEELIKRYTQRTRTSKQLARDYRHIIADSKATVGFNLSTKPMLYPIIGKRARGSRIWDIDDNEYIDVTMGFGVYLFGHHPAFLREALQERPMDDTQLGPRSYLVGEVAELISQFTGMERVAFANTGTEAVMTAIRLARAATGRTKIAMFSRSYHGHSDATLAVSFTRNGKLCSEPVSPGIPPGVVGEVLVVDYLDPRSLEIISTYGHQLAAVLVEPVQSRYPGVQPGEFLEQLSQITRRSGTALIFDEMITGFRLHPGGAQAYFNVEADLCTYGKIIGGGLPIGVIAGKARYLDGIDGGPWDDEDGSYPGVERTFFGGTFCQYHEAMVAARAVLQYLGEQGPDLQKQLNQRTKKFAETLNNYFEQTGISMRIAYFSSIFRFDIQGGMDLFFYHLLEKGVYIWEWRSCFLSTAHTDEDLDYVIDAVKESIEELQSGGFSLKGAAKVFHVKEHYYPMSSVQKRLYALSQTGEGERAYHVPAALRIEGVLDIKKVESVFKKLIRRHDILRTGLEIKDEQLVQRVYAYEEVEFSLIYHNYPGYEESAENIRGLIEEVLQPFDLSKPPLMRVSVTEVAPARFIFITDFHHTIFDGTSATILAQDFMGLYQGSEMPPLKLQYKDYTYREQHDISSPDFRAHRDFWANQLAGELPVLALPTDFPRPAVLDFAGSTLRFKIGERKTARMKELARKTDASLNMLLLAIFNVLLFKLTGQEDICVGIPVDVRGHGDFQHTLGMFTNTLVLRNYPAAGKSFTRFLSEMKTRFLQAYTHQEYPYEELVASVGRQRDISRNPFFDVIFGFEIGDYRIYKIPGLTFTAIDINPGVSPFDLFFEVVEEEGHLHVGIFYRTGLFKEETIKRWKQYYETLMDELLQEPGSLLSALDMVTEPEKQTLLHEFNDTAVDYPKDRTIDQLFQEQVEKNPDKIAIAAHSLEGHPALTYRELDEKSNQLAHLLRAKGVDPDTNPIAAVMEERSVEMIVGIIAILKAGGAYLPIDPDYPGERINYMLTDSNAGILLSKVSELSKVSGGIEVIDLPSFIVENENRGPTHLCYVLYTSGSTGGPKGVMVEHRNVVRLVKQVNYVELSGETRILQTGAPVFDATTFEIWGALLNGGQLFLVDKDTILDAGQLGNALKKYQVNVLWLTSPLFNQLVRQDSNMFSTLEWLLVGGDVLSPQRIDAVRRRNRDLKIVNGYGPTENTTFSTTYLIQQDFEGDIPIGKPISNSTVYILDHTNHLQPLGVVGELCVGGDGVSRGYLNNPELTAEKFIEYRSYRTNRTYIPSQKIYKTGDLARWLVDGNIEFLGRRDQQVKIRGFRIELGEIESKLLCHEDIKDAVVIAGKGEDEPGDQGYLCAYIVSDKTVEIPGLMEHLSGELPGYMMPSYFIRIDKIPLTPNGKIDMKGLPSPEVKAGKDYIAPRNEIEEKLVEIWSKVLKIDKEAIGINSNFFHLGGHSLKAAIVINKIEKEFGTTIKFGNIFASPTVWSISRIIMGAAGDRRHRYSSIDPVEKKDYYELSSAQKRLYILHQMESGNISYNVSVLMPLEEDIDKEKLETAFRKLIARHESLRTTFEMLWEKPVQRVHEPDRADFVIEYVDARDLAYETGRRKVEEMIHNFKRPFDLSGLPLLRVGLVKTVEKEILLLLDVHHIIMDGTSLNILINELWPLYRGDEFVPLDLQYKDYSEWQNSKARKALIKQQEAYWLKEFSHHDELPVINLPTDYPRPLVQSLEGTSVNFALNAEETKILKNIAKDNEVTLYMCLLALFNVLFSKLSGQEDIIFGTAIAARRHVDLQNIIGMLVNSLAMRNYPAGPRTFKEFLKEVKQRTLEAYENQEYPFEELVDHLLVTRDTSRNPVFDMMFNALNQWESPEKIPGNRQQSSYEFRERTSRFDIAINATEMDQWIDVEIEYCTRLFTIDTIERFMNYFRKIVVSVSGNTDQKLVEIEMLTPGEKEKILLLSTGVKEIEGVGQEQPLHRLFQEKAARIPDSTALVFADRNLSYGELNRRANQLARVLREKGAGSHTGGGAAGVVGLMVERSMSIEMIIAILAILKAGGAYLPIDPGYPEQRILSMLSDSGVNLLLTARNSLADLSITSLRNMKTGREKPVITPPRPQIKDFDRLPIPDRTLIDYEKYHRYIGEAPAKNTITLQATRGCPYNCLYCHKIWPKTHVVRRAENIFKEISYAFAAGIKRFVFIDDIFNLDETNSSRLLEMIIKSRWDIQLFFPSGFRADILSKDFIDLMMAAGTVNLDVALESASPRIQKLIRKNLNLEKFKENVQYITEKYPEVILEMEMMHGFPTETREEALMTLDFLKNLKWVDFPNLHILKIFPNTDICQLARANGISEESIQRSANLGFHELPETLPFPKSFTRQFQARFMGEYFLLKERLLQVLPHQANILTEDELVQKYDSYLPAEIRSFDDILRYTGISREELGDVELKHEDYPAPGFCQKIRKYFPVNKPAKDAFRILLLDLSQLFTEAHEHMLHHQIEEPLGLLYLMTYLNKTFKHRIHGKVFKSRIDFDSYDELKQIMSDFKPHLLGIRTLSFYKEFFHRTTAMIRQWGVDAPIIAGGPYATSDYNFILQDFNVDLVVLGEGELTLAQLVEKMMENNNTLPGEEILQDIHGIAFLKDNHKALSKESQREIILLDEISGGLAEYPGENLEFINQSGDPLYVIYTSGSTGKPKGVMLEHRNLANLIQYQYHHTSIDFSRVLQFTTVSFDVSAQEIFSTLLAGGRLSLIGKDTLNHVPELFRAVERDNVKTLFLPASFLKFVINEEDLVKLVPKGLKHIVTAGEQVIINERFKRYLQESNVYFHNHYGPSETHVVTTFTMGPSRAVPDLPPIGRPISNTWIYILDKGSNLVPVTVGGELVIAGTQVGRGYLNRPELTAERFLDLAAKTREDTRNSSFRSLYQTGDLARWLPDGNIQFLGRIDQQVKIRGFRVELGEIESRLLNHEQVKEAVVIDRGDGAGDKHLCAYVVPAAMPAQMRARPHDTDTDINSEELTKYLSQSLPDYMIPSYFVFLKQIPLTPNRKIDRGRLPEPQQDAGGDYIKPGNAIEEKLAELWSEVLNLEKNVIGVDINFFRLGGQSLKATVMAMKIHKALNVKLPLNEVFKTPTIRGLAGYIKSAVKDKYISIEPSPLQEYYPLSSAQKRLYIVQQMDETGSGYNLPGIFLLEGVLDTAKLEAAFKGLIQRHESFRTSFHLIREQPVQKIHEQVEFAIEYYDTSKNFIRPFDLSQAPLLRVGLIKLEEEKPAHILMFDMHHIISDGISIKIFLHDLKALYEGRVLPGLRLQYKDFSRWQNNMIASGGIKSREEYWLDRFRDEIPVLNLPTDYSRPPLQRFEGSHIRFEIGKELTGPLKQLSLDTGATLYMVLLAFFNIFLGKLTGQEDIAVGGPTAGRRHDELENIVGMFVNTLVLRNNPAGEKTFTGFLEEVKECTLAAFENQDYQYEELVEQVVKTRDMSRNPLFDVIFALQEEEFNIWSQKMELKGLNVSPYQYEEMISKFDMSLFVEEMEDKGKMVFTFEYSTNLFKKETIERLVSYFKNVLSGVLPDPGTFISEIEIIGEEEKNQVLTELNDTAAAYPGDKTIQQLFEEQVERTPDSTAVVCVGQIVGAQHVVPFHDIQLTYRELNEKSHRLACVLIERGVLADDIVAIMVEPSPGMIIGILAVLKAGAAYLPISPDYPGERKRYIIKDSNIKVLLANTEDLPHDVVESIQMDDPGVFKRDGNDEGNRKGNPLAYVIYTSGSTGKPKGVMIEHQSVVNILMVLQRLYPVTPADVYLLKTSFTFDVSITELFGWFPGGGRLAILKKGWEKEPQKILDTVKKAGVTHINFVPSMFNVFVEYLFSQKDTGGLTHLSDLNPVKYIFLAGESLLPELVKKFRQLAAGKPLENLYGPTEGTIYASRYSLAEWNGPGNIPIGKPISNIRLYIVDKYSHLQPKGVPGELCIGGDGVSPGYLNNPELTAEKFFSVFYRSNRSYRTYSSEKVYKTGDLARWLPDGNIEFLGRIDSQVKIRGYRIEPGEIESRLIQHNGITEAIVLVGRDESGDNYLCAYIVPYPVDAAAFADPSSIQGELKKHLSQFLPDYMIPTRFVSMEKMPLTPSGKVDRKALPAPGTAAGVEYAAPRSEMEDTLARLWSRVLGIEKEIIGIDDNFIERGGQSLKAILLIAKIHQTFNVRLSLAKFFEIPVIRQLSQFIKTAARDQYIAVQPIEKKQYYGLSSAQKRLYVIQQIEPDSTTYNMPIVVVLEGRLEKEKLEVTFRKLIDRHESLRTSIEVVSRQPVQKIHDEVVFEIEYHDAAHKAPGARHSKQRAGRPASIIEAFIRPFDLSQAPYIRAGLIKTGKQEHILMVDMHHIVSDANSHEILMKEFSALYHGETLSALRLQYRDFCQWQNKQLISGEIKKQEEYWLEEFKGKIPVLKMPTDYPRLEMRMNKGRTVVFEIASGEAGNLRALARREDATMFMVLLALFNIVLYKISRQEDIVIGTIVAGRRHVDLENIIGMFINTLALRSYPGGDQPFIEFLREVRKRTLAAFDNQDYQFEDLVEKVMSEREVGRNPLFDVLFSFTSSTVNDINKSSASDSGRAEEPVEPGLTVKPYEESEETPAKFDMIFTGGDTGGNLFFVIEYNAGLFQEETIERFIEYFKEIVSVVKGNESMRLKDIKISCDLVTATSDIYQKRESEFEF